MDKIRNRLDVIAFVQFEKNRNGKENFSKFPENILIRNQNIHFSTMNWIGDNSLQKRRKCKASVILYLGPPPRPLLIKPEPVFRTFTGTNGCQLKIWE